MLAQSVLMALTVGLAFAPPGWPRELRLPGIALAVAGAAVVVWAARALGRFLTPYPRPREDAVLVEHGPYRFARHPIYAGGLLFFLGVGIATSVPATAGALALGLLWRRKAAVEERYLAAAFPAYEDYRRRVSRRM